MSCAFPLIVSMVFLPSSVSAFSFTVSSIDFSFEVALVFSVIGIYKLKSVSFIVDDLPKDDKIYTDLKFFEKNFSSPPGETTTRTFAGVVPTFLKLCGIPLGAKTNAPVPATIERLPTVTSS